LGKQEKQKNILKEEMKEKEEKGGIR